MRVAVLLSLIINLSALSFIYWVGHKIDEITVEVRAIKADIEKIVDESNYEAPSPPWGSSSEHCICDNPGECECFFEFQEPDAVDLLE